MTEEQFREHRRLRRKERETLCVVRDYACPALTLACIFVVCMDHLINGGQLAKSSSYYEDVFMLYALGLSLSLFLCLCSRLHVHYIMFKPDREAREARQLLLRKRKGRIRSRTQYRTLPVQVVCIDPDNLVSARLALYRKFKKPRASVKTARFTHGARQVNTRGERNSAVHVRQVERQKIWDEEYARAQYRVYEVMRQIKTAKAVGVNKLDIKRLEWALMQAKAEARKAFPRWSNSWRCYGGYDYHGDDEQYG